MRLAFGSASSETELTIAQSHQGREATTGCSYQLRQLKNSRKPETASWGSCFGLVFNGTVAKGTYGAGRRPPRWPGLGKRSEGF